MDFRDWLRKRLYFPRSLFDPTKNYSNWVEKLIDKNSSGKVLDVGSGTIKRGDEVIRLDKFNRGDIKGDATSLPIKSTSVDLLISIAVLEHLKEPYESVKEMYRVLKKGGEVYIEIPFMQPFHGSPDDYYRATLPGLKHWCREFEELDSGVCVGPGSAVSWIEIEYIRLWFGKIPVIGLVLESLFRLWSLPLKHLDRWLIDKEGSSKVASAIYFYGRKK